MFEASNYNKKNLEASLWRLGCYLGRKPSTTLSNSLSCEPPPIPKNANSAFSQFGPVSSYLIPSA